MLGLVQTQVHDSIQIKRYYAHWVRVWGGFGSVLAMKNQQGSNHLELQLTALSVVANFYGSCHCQGQVLVSAEKRTARRCSRPTEKRR